jgi:hypothetical protein
MSEQHGRGPSAESLDSGRERIVHAAYGLFSREGVRTVRPL